jgi:hypothetical protein
VGRWKLVVHDGAVPSDGAAADPEQSDVTRGADPVELFDLVADPNERRNLAARNPSIVRDLEGRLAAYAAVAVPALAGRPRGDFKAPRVWGVFEK